MKPEKELRTYDNGRQRCSLCGYSIPQKVQRVSMYYNNSFGGGAIRVCGLCIYRLSIHLDYESIEKFKQKVAIDEL